MKALGDGAALFVGGCVRGALLEREVGDIDLATSLTPEEVTKKLEAAGIKAVPTGIEHGTVTAVVEGKPFEITTLRRDVETDGRRAVVAFTEDWREDAQRRDFTMNTLLADDQGNIFDPTGQGFKDLEAQRVVFVGDPAQRIAEDTLRILRFFRFHASYGAGEPDAKALEACREAAAHIADLSRERITQEVLRILAVDDPVAILKTMFENNVLKDFSFVDYQPDILKFFCELQDRYHLGAIAPRLFLLAGLTLENIVAMEKFLLIPKVFHKDIQALDHILALPDLADDHAVKVAVYKHGRTNTAQALLIEIAQDRVMNGYGPQALEIIQNWDIPTFPVSGEDLMKAGIKEGPDLGKKLHEIEEKWVSEGFTQDKEACLSSI